MVRIKGANSDYTYVGEPAEAPIQENKNASPLFMEIFVCPNDMPSRVEAPHEHGWCDGTDAGCPGGDRTGHAKVRLEQGKGIILSAKSTDALQISDQAVTAAVPLQVQDTLTVEMNTNTQKVRFAVAPDSISMQVADGTAITITQNGINVSSNTSTPVAIIGNLDLSEATVSGFSPTMLQALAPLLAPYLAPLLQP